jgi:hypothetical protein
MKSSNSRSSKLNSCIGSRIEWLARKNKEFNGKKKRNNGLKSNKKLMMKESAVKK